MLSRRKQLRRCVCCLATAVMGTLTYHAYLLVMHDAPGMNAAETSGAALPSAGPAGAHDTATSTNVTTAATSITRKETTAMTPAKLDAPSKPPAVSNLSHATPEDGIPFILHQTWISDRIPATYVPFAKSWVQHKPPLAYYYWTDASSLRFVAKHYPELLATFRGYKAHLSRADAIRYMLLHHYGGVYADMDMMRLKDLTPLLNSSQELCYLSQERYEITRLFWGLDSSVMNAIMLSAPGHKFMEYVVRALPRYAHHTPNVMESTGPFFLQNVYNEYQKSPPCNLSSPMCRCAVADPYMFMPQVDPIRIPMFRSKCFRPGVLKPNQQKACDMLEKVGWRNDVQSLGGSSYTHHGFLHYGFEDQRLRFHSVADIGSIRPDKLVFGKDFQ